MKKHFLVIYVLWFLISSLTMATPTPDPAIPITPQPDGALCWDHQTIEADLQEETFEAFIAGVGENRGIYFSFKPIGTDIRPLGNSTYQTLSELSAEVELFTSQPQRLRYFALLNEQMTGPAQELTLTPNEITKISFTVPPLMQGVNDLIFVAIPLTDEPLRPTGDPRLHALRMSLIHGQPTSEALQFTRLPKIGSKQAGDPQFLLHLTLDESLRAWNYPDPTHRIRQGDRLSFYLWTTAITSGNPSVPTLPPPEVSRFALLGFLNDQPLPLTDDQPIIYGELERDTAHTRLLIETEVNLSVGTYELLILNIQNPRIPLCQLFGPHDGYFFSTQVAGHRVALEIEAE
ncbi:MAG: hypothetical protein MUF87_09090 [Anaerolineae bacterium]|jgi:hypothetical protein|nr:hypothetical protein [Anaerolineae bacterium]